MSRKSAEKALEVLALVVAEGIATQAEEAAYEGLLWALDEVQQLTEDNTQLRAENERVAADLASLTDSIDMALFELEAGYDGEYVDRVL